MFQAIIKGKTLYHMPKSSVKLVFHMLNTGLSDAAVASQVDFRIFL